MNNISGFLYDVIEISVIANNDQYRLANSKLSDHEWLIDRSVKK